MHCECSKRWSAFPSNSTESESTPTNKNMYAAGATDQAINEQRDTSISFDFSESNETKRNTKTNRTDVVQCDDIHTTGRL